MSVESEWHLGNNRWEEVGVETIVLHALADEVDRCDVRAVRDIGVSSAACHQTSNSTLAISDTRAGVARLREGSRL